jgi:hypothetical protein
MLTIVYACHFAYLDPMTGSGLLVLPDPAHDVPPVGAGSSLHAAAWNHAMTQLDGMGWELSEDEDSDCWSYVGRTVEGRDVIGLYGREPVTTRPTLDEDVEAWGQLAALAGLAGPIGGAEPVLG